MEKTRFHTGMENLKKIDGKCGETVIRSLGTIAPDLGKYIVEFALGDIYERSGLSLQLTVHPIYRFSQSAERRLRGKKDI